MTLYRDVIMPGETFPSAEVETEAVRCMGLCCLLDKVAVARPLAEAAQALSAP